MQVFVAKDHHGYTALFEHLEGAFEWLIEMSDIETLTKGSSGIYWSDDRGECSVELMEVR